MEERNGDERNRDGRKVRLEERRWLDSAKNLM
jgi:hypothetical protein